MPTSVLSQCFEEFTFRVGRKLSHGFVNIPTIREVGHGATSHGGWMEWWQLTDPTRRAASVQAAAGIRQQRPIGLRIGTARTQCKIKMRFGIKSKRSGTLRRVVDRACSKRSVNAGRDVIGRDCWCVSQFSSRISPEAAHAIVRSAARSVESSSEPSTSASRRSR